MTNQWKRALSGIVTLAMLLSCAAINVSAAAGDLTAGDFSLAVEQNAATVTVKLVCAKEVSGWGGGKGTLAVKSASGADASPYFTVNSTQTSIGDPNNPSGNKWVWSSTLNDTENGETIAANSTWVEYSLTASETIPAGNYTFSMTFDEGENFDKDLAEYAVDGQTVTAAAPYTAAAPTGYTVTLTDGAAGTAEVNPGSSVTMNVVVSGKGFNGMQAEIGYDSSLFTLTGVTGIDTYQASAGTVSMYLLSRDIVASGTTVAALHFTANALASGTAEKVGAFTIAKGTADDMTGFATQDAVPAALIGDAVKVAEERSYTITLAPAVNGSVSANKTTANEGDTVTLTPNPADGYEIDTLTVTGESGDTVSVTNSSFTMPGEAVTVTATFKAKSYPVSLSGSLTGDATATHGTDYTASVTGYDAAGNDYALTVTIGGTAYTGAALSESGTLTIPGSAITGSISITLVTTPKPFQFSSQNDYVTGAVLVLVTGSSASGYTYGGNAMFYVEKYSAYAYVVEGTPSRDSVAAAASGTPVTISAGYDVNGTGTVDFNDAGAAFGCYNKSYTVAENVALYLRADVNGDKQVDTGDVSAVMEHYTPDGTAGN